MKRLPLLLLTIILGNLLMAQTITEVTSKEVQSYLEHYNDDSHVIIDGRTQSMFNAGHVKNAVLINAYKEDAQEKLRKYLDKERIILYCTTNKRSRTIIKILKELGYNGEIVYIPEGITGWKKRGYEIVPYASTYEQSKLRPIVQVFGTAGYDVDNQHFSYGFGRAHLGLQYKFNDRWRGKIIIDRGRPTTMGDISVTDTEGNHLDVTNTASEGSYYTMWLKFASLTWQVNNRLSLEGGALLQNHYITQERFWGLRYVAQTFQDMYWHIPSTDLGFMARYKINNVLGIDAALTNGEGPRKNQDSEGAVKSAIGIDIVPSENIQTRLYYRNAQAIESENENEQMFSAFAGFHPTKKLRIGAEYNHMSHFSNLNNLNSYGYSVYSVLSINEVTEVFGRFDYLAFDIPENIDDFNQANSNAFIAGMSYIPVQKVSLSLNYQGRIYDESTLENKNSVMLSMEYKF